MAGLQAGILRIDTPPLPLDLSPPEQGKAMDKMGGTITPPKEIFKKWLKDEAKADKLAGRFKIQWSASEKDEQPTKPPGTAKAVMMAPWVSSRAGGAGLVMPF